MQLDFDFTHKIDCSCTFFLPLNQWQNFFLATWHKLPALWICCRQAAAARINQICTMSACTLSLYDYARGVLYPCTFLAFGPGCHRPRLDIHFQILLSQVYNLLDYSFPILKALLHFLLKTPNQFGTFYPLRGQGPHSNKS